MKLKALLMLIGACVLATSVANACPKDTHLEGGEGPYHKGGKCVPNTPITDGASQGTGTISTPTATPTLASKDTAKATPLPVGVAGPAGVPATTQAPALAEPKAAVLPAPAVETKK